MDREMLELYSDYLLASFGQTSATRLSQLLEVSQRPGGLDEGFLALEGAVLSFRIYTFNSVEDLLEHER